MYDALSVLQTEATKTATANGPAVDTMKGTQGRTLWARVNYKAATNVSGSNGVVFSIEESSDNSSFTQVSAAPSIALSTTAQTGEIFLPVLATKRYVRLTATISGAGSTPSITYSGDLGLSQP